MRRRMMILRINHWLLWINHRLLRILVPERLRWILLLLIRVEILWLLSLPFPVKSRLLLLLLLSFPLIFSFLLLYCIFSYLLLLYHSTCCIISFKRTLYSKLRLLTVLHMALLRLPQLLLHRLLSFRFLLLFRHHHLLLFFLLRWCFWLHKSKQITLFFSRYIFVLVISEHLILLLLFFSFFQVLHKLEKFLIWVILEG